MTAHTPGRIMAHEIEDGKQTLVSDVSGSFVPDLLVRLTEANARRLAACWNACEGVETDDIEQWTVNTGPLLINKIREVDALHVLISSERAAAITERNTLERRIAAQREEIGRLHAKIGKQQDEAKQQFAERAERDEVLAAGYMKLQNNLATAHADARAIEANYEAARALLVEVLTENDAWIKEAIGLRVRIDPDRTTLTERIRAFLKGGA
jgi:uncharacterized membrane-anchored protein YhcB (DUF1043 family)